MKKVIPLVILLLLVVVGKAQATMVNFLTFTGEGANISVDAVGLNDNTDGIISAEIAANATIEAAYLYSAAVGFNNEALFDVVFDGNTLTSDASSRLDVGVREGNTAFAENRWDVTSIVQSKYNSAGGIFDFTVNETGYLDGEVLAVVYGIAGDDVKTAFVFDGELSSLGDSFNINLPSGYDGTSDAILSLGISFGFQGTGQDSQVDINGTRLTSSAGGQDDGFGLNGGLITAGGVGDSILNPADPNALSNGNPRQDDELYNIAGLLNAGDNLITIDTLNPSEDDNIFFTALTINGEATVGPKPVPEPATIALLGIGIVGLAGAEVRRRRKKKAVDNS